MLARLQQFSMDIETLMSTYGVDTSTDIGRRNNFLSWVQEHLVAKSLGVVSDGRTGRPDMLVGAHPVECRIISPRQCGGSTLSATRSQIEKSEISDFVYIVAARDMLSFAFLHIPDVTVEDIKPQTRRGGQKAYIVRSRVSARLKCLHGSASVTPKGFRIVLHPL